MDDEQAQGPGYFEDFFEDVSRERPESMQRMAEAQAAQMSELEMRQQNPIHASMLKYFEYARLPEKLQDVSKVFHTVAYEIAGMDLDGREAQVALRKLLEAKDAAVRAALYWVETDGR